MNWNISIKDYMGRVGDGILTLICIINDGVAYDATYYYTSEKQIITIPDTLKIALGVSDIEEHQYYPQLLLKIKKTAIPHSDMINSIDDLDLSKYVPLDSADGEDIDDAEITFATQSQANT